MNVVYVFGRKMSFFKIYFGHNRILNTNYYMHSGPKFMMAKMDEGLLRLIHHLCLMQVAELRRSEIQTIQDTLKRSTTLINIISLS